MSDCDRCGLDIFSECTCSLQRLEERVKDLENKLYELNEKEIFKKLEIIDHQIKFLADAYKNIHNMFVKGVHVTFEKTLLEPNLSKLQFQSERFERIIHELNELSKDQTFLGTLAFMSKRIYEMERAISEMKEEGIKKKIHLDITMDGVEMVKKKPVIKQVTKILRKRK